MARKYDLISELYRRTAHAVVSDVQNWQAFLRCACRNYRLRFDEQLLIYAQRPDATAVLEIERWNDKFARLEYMFDVITTHEKDEILKSFKRAQNAEERETILINLIEPYFRIHKEKLPKRYTVKYLNKNILLSFKYKYAIFEFKWLSFIDILCYDEVNQWGCLGFDRYRSGLSCVW